MCVSYVHVFLCLLVPTCELLKQILLNLVVVIETWSSHCQIIADLRSSDWNSFANVHVFYNDRIAFHIECVVHLQRVRPEGRTLRWRSTWTPLSVNACALILNDAAWANESRREKTYLPALSDTASAFCALQQMCFAKAQCGNVVAARMRECVLVYLAGH